MSPDVFVVGTSRAELGEALVISEVSKPRSEFSELGINISRQRFVFKIAMKRNAQCGAVVVLGMCAGSAQAPAFAKRKLTVNHAESHHIVRNIQSKIRTYFLKPPHIGFYFVKRLPFIGGGISIHDDRMVNVDFGPAQHSDRMPSSRQLFVGSPFGSSN